LRIGCKNGKRRDARAVNTKTSDADKKSRLRYARELDRGLDADDAAGKSSASSFRSIRTRFSGNPAVDEFSSLQVILLEHNHVPIASYSEFLKRSKFYVHSGLLQKCGRQVVKRRVVRCFSGDHNHRDPFEIYQFPCRVRLNPSGFVA
jgi:hypothetical protein